MAIRRLLDGQWSSSGEHVWISKIMTLLVRVSYGPDLDRMAWSFMCSSRHNDGAVMPGGLQLRAWMVTRHFVAAHADGHADKPCCQNILVKFAEFKYRSRQRDCEKLLQSSELTVACSQLHHRPRGLPSAIHRDPGVNTFRRQTFDRLRRAIFVPAAH